MSELLTKYPIVVTVPVQWGEMDAYGVVNNTVYFRYFQASRAEYLERCGLFASYDRDLIGAILHSTECRYRASLQYPDMVVVGSRVSALEDDRFTVQHRALSQRSGRLAAEGSAVIVAFDYRARTKTKLPDAVRRRIAEIEGWDKTGADGNVSAHGVRSPDRAAAGSLQTCARRGSNPQPSDPKSDALSS